MGWHGGQGRGPSGCDDDRAFATSPPAQPLCSGPPPLVFTHHHYFFLKDLLHGRSPSAAQCVHTHGRGPHGRPFYRCLYLHLLCGGGRRLHSMQFRLPTTSHDPNSNSLLPASCLCPFSQGLRPRKAGGSHLPLRSHRACGVPHPICDDRHQLNFLKASVCQIPRVSSHISGL